MLVKNLCMVKLIRINKFIIFNKGDYSEGWGDGSIIDILTKVKYKQKCNDPSHFYSFQIEPLARYTNKKIISFYGLVALIKEMEQKEAIPFNVKDLLRLVKENKDESK